MENTQKTYNVLIASYLEPEHIERIRQVDDCLNVVYRPDLLGVPRYAADHSAPNARPDSRAGSGMACSDGRS